MFAVAPGDEEAGRAVVQHSDVVSFTGSGTAGRSVATAATARGIPVQAEMGGKNPAIVLPGADLERPAGQVATAALGFAGQKCTATKRVIVVGDPGPFRDALVTAATSLGVGNPADPATAVGPVIDEAARDRVVASAADAVASGGRLLTGGRASDRDGWFIPPTLLESVPVQHPPACDQAFGPIAVLQQVSTVAEAVDLANAVPLGLAAGIYTQDLAVALHATESLDAGLVKVNAPTTGVDFYAPCGGEKGSSIGPREQGKAAQDFYTSTHTVTLAPGVGGR